MEFNNGGAGSQTEDTAMRDILHKTREVLGGRGKTVLIREHADDKQCVTDVRKHFIYMAQETEMEEKTCVPQVHIAKSFDSATQDEKFAFRVKGYFFVHRNRRLVKVDYCHTLRINLHWKTKKSSPKKSVTMA